MLLPKLRVCLNFLKQTPKTTLNENSCYQRCAQSNKWEILKRSSALLRPTKEDPHQVQRGQHLTGWMGLFDKTNSIKEVSWEAQGQSYVHGIVMYILGVFRTSLKFFCFVYVNILIALYTNNVSFYWCLLFFVPSTICVNGQLQTGTMRQVKF